MEKHSRGFVARADREARIQEKELRKSMKENRYLMILDFKFLVLQVSINMNIHFVICSQNNLNNLMSLQFTHSGSPKRLLGRTNYNHIHKFNLEKQKMYSLLQHL